METLVIALLTVIVLLAVGALAAVFGADSRDGMTDGDRDSREPAAGGIR